MLVFLQNMEAHVGASISPKKCKVSQETVKTSLSFKSHEVLFWIQNIIYERDLRPLGKNC